MPQLAKLGLEVRVVDALRKLRPEVKTAESLLERDVDELSSGELSREEILRIRREVSEYIVSKDCIRWTTTFWSRLSYISTGNARLDALLGGGIRRGEVLELFGKSGTGKTTFCLTAASLAAKQKQQVVWIDACTCAFDPKRLYEIAASSEDFKYIGRCFASEPMEAIALIEEVSADLIIIDSVQSLLAPNMGAILGHFALSALGHALTRRATLQKTAILIVNGLVRGHALSSSQPTPADDCLPLGLSWSYVATTRLKLSAPPLSLDEDTILSHFLQASSKNKPSRRTYTALLDRHPSLPVFPPRSADFYITSRGILDEATPRENSYLSSPLEQITNSE